MKHWSRGELVSFSLKIIKNFFVGLLRARFLSVIVFVLVCGIQ
jgi:hypothetical protein